MLFSSPIFIFLFLPLVIFFNIFSKNKTNNVVLLIFSAIFYIWGEAVYFLLVAALVAVNWLTGIWLDRVANQSSRKAILISSVLVNIGTLVYFKYTNFIIGNINDILVSNGVSPFAKSNIHLPLGISFFTFHLLSYVIDIYRRVARAQNNPINFGLYVLFFPQLIAGPIIRYHDVESQLTDRRVTLEGFSVGVERFVLGLGKKMLIANPLGHVADQIFALSAKDLSSPVAWLGIVSYTFQIYFDFSGYSDMAIGLARMFGFRFLENFNYPYIARSMQDFWRRWHISLSNWFRDYLYIPLGGNRKGPFRTYLNLLIVFFLCGFWHGASWNFVIWGLIHGGFLVIERSRVGAWIGRLPGPVAHVYVMAVVMLAWVFFRADTLSSASSFLAALAGKSGETSGAWPFLSFFDRQTQMVLPIAVLASTPFASALARDWLARRRQSRGEARMPAEIGARAGAIERVMAMARPPILLAIFVLASSFVAGQTYNPFIYFRF